MIELMTKEIHELTLDELKTLLTHYENHEEKYKYEFKIRRIERTLKKREKNHTPAWIELAKEDKATKDKWLKLGATWECTHSYTTWYYEGKPFYRWWSRTDVNQEIHRLREADKELMKMIETKRERT